MSRRPGKTKNVSVSLGSEAQRILMERAASMHDGNLSAAVTEAGELLRREVALSELAGILEKAIGPLTDEARARVDREWLGLPAASSPAARASTSTKRKRSAA